MSTSALVPQRGYLSERDGNMQRFPAYKVDGDDGLVPREVSAARRNAAAALTLTVAIFGLSLALVFHTAPPSSGSGAGSLESPSNAAIGLYAAEPTHIPQASPMNGFTFFDDSDEEYHGILHPPYHLVVDTMLQRHASVGDEPLRQIRQGTQIFPVRYQGEWVQVVVPKGDDGSDAAMGWLPRHEKGAALMERDSYVRNRPAGPRQPPPSDEEMRKRWQEVRAKNGELKEKVAELQRNVKGTYSQQVRSVKSSAAKGAEEVFNVGELRKMVGQVRNGVHKELKRSPEQIIRDFERAVEE
mmetsp:Transcript_7498/g.18936  ORF Transcript_7498/g.18936 Transcript_7498/m.18936 type:complete len:299 (-) Transcript_7498:223-1119(-)|eukprot:CAMPEP_0115225206 /NCGR_PEP_ID=MMETSP0270-20121206/29982_1 /TAXON_ID=71861 /ORGANISM="Scrippsiella trochoidea, Strain CCMP3099" /LENGTH=298 /DNA_ID=CAMNT_0002639563 /DNA_START=97 /DNA_END=993 /DNA_ORIENTATION=-